jgi:hypothetical protein
MIVMDRPKYGRSITIIAGHSDTGAFDAEGLIAGLFILTPEAT